MTLTGKALPAVVMDSSSYPGLWINFGVFLELGSEQILIPESVGLTHSDLGNEFAETVNNGIDQLILQIGDLSDSCD